MDVGAPHLLSEGARPQSGGAVSQRTSIPRVLPPWSDETPPFARTSGPAGTCAHDGILVRASPCPPAFCRVPYGPLERAALLWATTFQIEFCNTIDARARPYGLLFLSRVGLPPRLVHEPSHRSRDARRVENRAFYVTASTDPHESIFPTRCFTGARASRWGSDEPKNVTGGP